VIAQFETANNVKINFLLSGDAGSLVNRAILSKGNPIADVLYGIDNSFLTRALEESIFESYQSPLLVNVPDRFQLDPDYSVSPVDYGDVCINYDKSFFEQNDLELPSSLEDLTEPRYAGLLVVENPATSSPGLAFLLATIAEYDEGGYLDYWQRLKDNAVVIVNDWETAYYGNFSGSSGQGQQPMVVSYGTSPAAEVIFAETELDEAPTASLVGDNMCYRQIEFVGILNGTQNRALAEKFVDFMLDTSFQEDIPLNMFVFPVNEQAQLPEEFTLHIQSPENPAELPLEQISSNRELWITAWRELMLQ
jgi:thiamine transport system substrate-binding protein